MHTASLYIHRGAKLWGNNSFSTGYSDLVSLLCSTELFASRGACTSSRDEEKRERKKKDINGKQGVSTRIEV